MERTEVLNDNNSIKLLSLLIEKISKIENVIEDQKKLMIYNKDILTLEEASIFTGLSKSTMYKNIHKINHYKPNDKHIFIKRSDLEEFLLRNEYKSKINIIDEAKKYISNTRK